MNRYESAFPSHGSMGEIAHEGMTLRDYFAAAALQGILAHQGPFMGGANNITREMQAQAAYTYAALMLNMREA